MQTIGIFITPTSTTSFTQLMSGQAPSYQIFHTTKWVDKPISLPQWVDKPISLPHKPTFFNFFGKVNARAHWCMTWMGLKCQTFTTTSMLQWLAHYMSPSTPLHESAWHFLYRPLKIQHNMHTLIKWANNNEQFECRQRESTFGI